MWLDSSLTWSPHNAPLGLLSDTKVLAKEKRKPSPNPKYWNRGVLTITYLSSIWRNYFPQIAELNWQIFQDKKEDFFETQKHTHTHTCTHTHSHTQVRFFCRLRSALPTVHVWIWFLPGFVMFVVLCTPSTGILFLI